MQTSVRTLFALAGVACAVLSSVTAYSDADILNFALNLECLEAEYYSWAAFGKGLTKEQRGGGPESIGGKKADLGPYKGAAEEIAEEEIKHVELLRAALGDLAVPCPLIDIGGAFSAAANAALGTTLDPPFSPYADYIKFLHGGLLFEDVGVMAYNGAGSVIRSEEYLATARSIMAVEAYHAGAIRTSLSAVYTQIVQPYGVPVSAIVTAISKTLDALLMLARDQPIGPLAGPNTNLTPTDKNALAFSVNPDAVLNVVYLSTTASKGGFFPEGINGLLGKTRGKLEDLCNDKAPAKRYEQCGGKYWSGATCCQGYNTCVMKDDYYSGCKPTPLPINVVAWYGTCGGKDYSGPTTCEPGASCQVINEYYSQCVPGA